MLSLLSAATFPRLELGCLAGFNGFLEAINFEILFVAAACVWQAKESMRDVRRVPSSVSFYVIYTRPQISILSPLTFV